MSTVLIPVPVVPPRAAPVRPVRVPLGELAAAHDPMLRRVLPEAGEQRTMVSAFNSSI
jgi:FXSXX-COOH protein